MPEVIRSIALLSLLVVVHIATLLVPVHADAAVNILTDRYDNSRTSANTAETALNVANVNAASFGKLWTYSVDGPMQSQPLYVSGLSVNGAVHNVLFVATMNDTVYAFDADTAGAALWTRSFTNPPAVTALPLSDIEPPTGGDIPIIGVRSTPVIDPATNTMYLVAHTRETSGSNVTWVQRLHALDITTGAERSGSPVTIKASAPGTAPDAVGGLITFDPRMQNQRAGLALANGQVVIAWASHDDILPYHGWVMTYSASTLAQTGVWVVAPDAFYGGIWQAGRAPAVDASGNVYFSTGNAIWDGTRNWGDSVVKLGVGSTGISLLDWFTPNDQATLNSQDLDLGSSGPMLIPNSNVVIAGGKEGILYTLNTASLGHNTSTNGQIVQSISTGAEFLHGFGVYWNSATLGPLVYNWSEGDSATAWHFNGTRFDSAVLFRGNPVSPGHPGGALVLSANGNKSGTGILWGQLPDANSDNGPTTSTLYAYNAETLVEIWDSNQVPGDQLGTYMKFATPISANGRIYMANADNQVVVYGLESSTPDFSVTVTPTIQNSPPGKNANYAVTVGAVNGFASSVALSVSGLPTGATATFSPATVTSSGSSTLQVTLPPGTALGNYGLTITGSGGGVTHSATVALAVVSATAPTFDTQAFSDSASATASLVSSSLSTSSTNELLLAFVAADYVAGANTTVTAMTGAGLTWTLVQRTNVQSGTAEIWRAFSPAKLTNVNVTATLSQPGSASLTVLSFSGVDTSGSNGSGAIGAIGTANSAGGAPNGSLVSTRANALVLAVGSDYDQAIARTPGAGQSIVHQYLSPAGDTYWVQSQVLPTSAAGQTVVINDTAPTTDRFNLSLVEVLPAQSFSLTGSITPTLLGARATLTLSGPSSATVSADASGNFTFAGVQNGTYTVTPTNNGVSFSPASKSVTVNGANATGVTFTATLVPSSDIPTLPEWAAMLFAAILAGLGLSRRRGSGIA